MKIFGHPIHPLLVHFPTSLLPMDFVLNILYYYTNNASFATAAFYCLTGGVTIGFLAIVTGIIELFYIPKWNKKALALGLYHGFLNGMVILIFGILTYRIWQYFPTIPSPGLTGLSLRGFLVLLLFVGNYLGGQLIYKYFIGINHKTKIDGHITA